MTAPQYHSGGFVRQLDKEVARVCGIPTMLMPHGQSRSFAEIEARFREYEMERSLQRITIFEVRNNWSATRPRTGDMEQMIDDIERVERTPRQQFERSFERAMKLFKSNRRLELR